MAEIREVTLGELAQSGLLQLGDGYRTKQSEHGVPGIPILRVAEVLDGKIAPKFEDYVSNTFRSAMGAKVSQPGDVVLTTKGTVGRVAIISADAPEFVYSPQLCFFRVAPGSPISAPYLYYWFKSEDFWCQARYQKGQTDMADYINLADIRSLIVKLPPKKARDAATAILGALDEKITRNGQAATIAAKLATLLYEKAVETDFVRNLVGTAANFHNRHRIPLSSAKRSELIGPYPYYGANGIIDYVADYRFDGDYVLVGEDGTVVTDEGKPVVRHARGKFWVSNHAHVLTGEQISNELLYIALKNANVRSHVTGAVQPKLSMRNLKMLDLKLPIPSAREALDGKIRKLGALAHSFEEESQAITALRDTLLPKLMSGELRVRDAEKVVEEVT